MLTISNCASDISSNSNLSEYPVNDVDLSSLFEDGNIDVAKDVITKLYNYALGGDGGCVELLQNIAIRQDELGELAQEKLYQIIQNALVTGETSEVAEVVQQCAQKVVMTGVAAGTKAKVINQNILYQSNILRLAGTVLPNNTSDSIPEVIKDEILRTGCKFEGQPSVAGDSWVRKANPKTNIAYQSKVSNTCPEYAAVFVAKRFGLDCEFKVCEPGFTGEIDIFPPLTKNAPPSIRKPLFIHGDNINQVTQYLQALNPNSVYIMRMGINQGSGHYQCLYAENGEWYVHDPKNSSSDTQITTERKLNTAGRNVLVRQRASWGMEKGQLSIAFAEVTQRGVRDLIPFIKDSRCFGEKVALQRLYAQHEQFV
ncbi:hypothetical protein SOPP22_07450 [Shewanella sp. OPT22]|nr:hypothetical protein SOPP22_07450 [Shewanella sp. OPT22]